MKPQFTKNAACLATAVALSGLTLANSANADPAAKKAAYRAKISGKQATKAALKKFPGKLYSAAKLEFEDGKWQYAVLVQSGKVLREVEVSAETGKVTDSEVTTPEAEAKEAKEDAARAKQSTGKAAPEAKESDEKDEKGEKD